MHVFIDTNILLNFFHFTKDEVDGLNDVFASHEYGSATVHLTEQVCDEFRRNRENKIKDALKKFKDVKFTAQLGKAQFVTWKGAIFNAMRCNP
jgi:predicted nucleic acid-binding protein